MNVMNDKYNNTKYSISSNHLIHEQVIEIDTVME